MAGIIRPSSEMCYKMGTFVGMVAVVVVLVVVTVMGIVLVVVVVEVMITVPVMTDIFRLLSKMC